MRRVHVFLVFLSMFAIASAPSALAQIVNTPPGGAIARPAPSPITGNRTSVTGPEVPPPASTPAASEAVIVDFGNNDRVLHVVTPAMRWTGVGTAPFATGTPPLDAVAPWTGDTLRLPSGIAFTGTPDPRATIEAPPRGAGVPARTTSPSNLWIELPIALRDLPPNVTRLIFNCSLSATDTAVRNGDFSDTHTIGKAFETAFYPVDGDAVGTVRLAVRLDPFMRKQDLKAVQCTTRVAVYRPEGGYIEGLRNAGTDGHRRFTPGLVPLAGAPFRDFIVFNIGG